VVDVLLLLGLGYCSKTRLLVLSFLFSFLVVCIRTAIRMLRYCRESVLPLGCCVIAEVGCNCYFLILIYSLYR
jgi:hypothetical protein